MQLHSKWNQPFKKISYNLLKIIFLTNLVGKIKVQYITDSAISNNENEFIEHKASLRPKPEILNWGNA